MGELSRSFQIIINSFRNKNEILEEMVENRTLLYEVLAKISEELINAVSIDEIRSAIQNNTGKLMYAGQLRLDLNRDNNESLDNDEQFFELIKIIIDEKKPLLLQKCDEKVGINLCHNLEGMDAKSWMGVPILKGNQVLGVLSVRHSEKEKAYNQEKLEFLQAIANVAANAISNMQLYLDLDYEKQYFESLVMNFPIAIVATDKKHKISIFNLLQLSF